MTRPAVVLFGEDLRLDDQQAVAAASGRAALFVYVYDESDRTLGGAAKWWLGRSLAALGDALHAKGGRLDILRGRTELLIPEVARAANAAGVYWGRRYGGGTIDRFKLMKATLAADGLAPRSFNTRLMREPWEVVGDNGRPYKVFTPFWRRHRALGPVPAAIPVPQRLIAAAWPDGAPQRAVLSQLGLRPTAPDWSGGMAAVWTPGEVGARELLRRFLDESLASYVDSRDRPDRDATSRLSPHLRFGEISPRRLAGIVAATDSRSAEKFLSELGWREFAYSLLYAAPDLATNAWSPKFERFPFRDDPAAYRAWTRGKTGYPIVDAGMRQLWATGYMHNRVRMIVASFLVKHLLIDWRRGERWFWDTLCDADEANNPASWQWVAGSGADAAPFFRIFNPTLQGEKFDSAGDYVRRWVPELERMDAAHIHAPWRAMASELDSTGVRLGRDYPEPIVDHAFARRRAIEALRSLGNEY
jgi:deoxyribodipyrimidine photo-lyase